MKMQRIFVALLLLAAASHGAAGPVKHYGPQGCVSLSKSTKGSCVLNTNCSGLDLNAFEFAFDCVVPSRDVTRHSFGLGGFDDVEEFDTDVACDRCETGAERLAAAASASKPKAAKKIVQATAKLVAAAGAVAPAKAVLPRASAVPQVMKLVASKADGAISKYGPKSCVSTWRSSEGECMMETKCLESDIAGYEFGLLCVNGNGTLERHIFGKDSFDPEETFDTQIVCTRCLGLGADVPAKATQPPQSEAAQQAQINALSSEVAELTKDMKIVSGMVVNLKTEVAARAVTTAPPPAQFFLARQSKAADDDDDDDKAASESSDAASDDDTSGSVTESNDAHHQREALSNIASSEDDDTSDVDES